MCLIYVLIYVLISVFDICSIFFFFQGVYMYDVVVLYVNFFSSKSCIVGNGDGDGMSDVCLKR